MSRIKVLQILAGAKEYNGVSAFLLSYYAHMDREKVHFDFLFCRENTMTSKYNEPFLMESHFIELHDKISGNLSDLKLLIDDLKKSFLKDKYDIVHIHTGSLLITLCCIIAARLAKVSCIISHSHNVNPKSIRHRSARKEVMIAAASCVLRQAIRKLSSMMLACSIEAGEYLFGIYGVKSKKFRVMPNAILTERYLFNEQTRMRLRSGFKINDETTVLGCVARFSEQKNHSFLIEVFYEYKKINPNSMLWLIGDGETKEIIEQKVKDMGIVENVRFFGQRSEVNELLQAMDAFILTSFYEGLGIVSIEAQAAGLKVFLPNEISHGSNISDLVNFISLRKGAKVWAEFINKELEKKYVRRNMYQIIKNNGYDISSAAISLEEIYLKMIH